eukprot:TRINITY_DN5027_c0_g2_i1.p1 TRINITY_DN5027_c0_g2~~TRINITY_DN5027_c0_g2_i1.p1  ORF type:complete len:242 (-),score=15.04 TRINITY_DN5027_c0_g2_i1:96-821(-)
MGQSILRSRLTPAKGAAPACQKGERLRFLYPDAAFDGNVKRALGRRRQPPEEFSFLLDDPKALESDHPEIGPSGRQSTARLAVSGALATAPENRGERYDRAGSYSYPHQVSEVNSLWSIEQCRQGKSAKQIRNFGKRIGSEGWARGSAPGNGELLIACPNSSRNEGGRSRVPVKRRRKVRRSPGNEQPTQNWYGQGESDCLIKTKHCDGAQACLHNVISAQCSECHPKEISPSAGKRREQL